MFSHSNRLLFTRLFPLYSVDPFVRKEWFDIKAPKYFAVRQVGKTVATKTTGQKTSRDSLLNREVTVSLGDLQPKGEDFRKFTLKVDEVVGTQCLTSFKGMDMTTDKLRGLVRKNQTLIEAYADVKTTDGYVLRVFTIGFTKRFHTQRRSTSYAQAGQVRQIRKKMVSIITRNVQKSDISQLILKLSTDVIGRTIERQCQSIYPLQNVFVRKVKVVRAPKTDLNTLMELHGGSEAIANFNAQAAAAGVVVARPEEAVVEEATA